MLQGSHIDCFSKRIAIWEQTLKSSWHVYPLVSYFGVCKGSLNLEVPPLQVSFMSLKMNLANYRIFVGL